MDSIYSQGLYIRVMQVEHRRDMMTESEVGVISFGDGPKIKKCRQSLEAGKKKKNKEINSPLGFPERI